MKKLIVLSLGLTVSFAAGAALAAPVTYALPDETAEFKPGPGVEAAQNHCASCHSADYLSAQPPKKGGPSGRRRSPR